MPTIWPDLVEVLGTPADTDEVSPPSTDGRPRREIEELLAGAYGIPADRVTDERTGKVGWEANCGKCGEIFNPDPMDVTRYVWENERTDCGGQGKIIGGWS
jgi:hypothetical protein